MIIMTEDNVIPHRRDPWCLYLKTGWGVYRVAHWRADFSCEQHAGPRWNRPETDPGFVLLSKDNDKSLDQRLTRFLEAIPEPVRRAAEPFTYMQYTVLRLMRLTDAARELAEDAPALFMLVAASVGRADMGWIEAAELLARPRRDIIRELLGAGTVLTPRFFRKLWAREWNADVFFRLEALLAAFRNQPGILNYSTIGLDNLTVLGLDSELFLTPFYRRLVQRAADEQQLAAVAARFKDAWRMAGQLNDEGSRRALRKASSYAQVVRIHDRLAHRLQASDSYELLAARWGELLPESPYPGDGNVEHVRTLAALREEGREMEHCVFSVAEEVFRGECAIYTMRKPERVTIRLDRADDGWVVGECRAARNREPSVAATHMLGLWMDECMGERRACA